MVVLVRYAVLVFRPHFTIMMRNNGDNGPPITINNTTRMTESSGLQSEASAITTGRKDKSSYRRRSVAARSRREVRRRPEESSSLSRNHGLPTFIFIPFPVPNSIPTDWLVQTSVAILVKHLLYTRGLFPMTVDQLISQNVDTARLSSHPADISINVSPSPSPSVRRTMRKAQDQVQRLLAEWSSLQLRMLKSTQELQQLAFILISIGPSYSQSKELFMLDIQELNKLKNGDALVNHSGSCLCEHQTQALEATLTRRLLGKMMSYEDSPLQEMPAKSSSSFRMFLTVGISHRPEAETIKTRNHSNLTPAQQRVNTFREVQTLSSVESNDNVFSYPLIERVGFYRNSRLSSSHRGRARCGQTAVCVNFQRPPPAVADDDSVKFIRSSDNLLPTSEQLSWLSIPPSIKGFRLPCR
jgi:hypothetical protein